MMNAKTKVCCILLALLTCAAAAGFSVGSTYARYENAVSYSTVLEASSPEMESSCLAMMGEAPVTVLMGELPVEGAGSLQVLFSVKSAADAERSLIWTVKDPNYAGYVTVTAVCEGTILSATETIALKANEEKTVTLTVTPTATAKTQAHGEINIDIGVTVGSLQGTFRVVLPKVEESSGTASGSASQSGSTNSPGAGEDAESPVEPEDSAGTETEEGAEEETETPEAEAFAQAFSNITPAFSGIKPMQNSTETETVNDDPETTENTESSETETSDSSVGTSSGDNQYGTGTAQIGINTVQSFDKRQLVPVTLSGTETADSVRLGFYNETMTAFPDYTRLSFNEGKSWYVICGGYIPSFGAEEISGPVLLDFSRTNLEGTQTLTFAAEALSGGELIGEAKTAAVLSEMDICETSIFSETEMMQLSEESESEEISENEKSAIKSRILTAGESLEITFPTEWIPTEESGYSFEYSINLLTLSQDGSYTPVADRILPGAAENSGLTAIHTADAETGTHNFVVRITDNIPQAGTYIAYLKWSYQGISFYETQITFFINYSAQTVHPSES